MVFKEALLKEVEEDREAKIVLESENEAGREVYRQTWSTNP